MIVYHSRIARERRPCAALEIPTAGVRLGRICKTASRDICSYAALYVTDVTASSHVWPQALRASAPAVQLWAGRHQGINRACAMRLTILIFAVLSEPMA